jgi:hypothetical protein
MPAAKDSWQFRLYAIHLASTTRSCGCPNPDSECNWCSASIATIASHAIAARKSAGVKMGIRWNGWTQHKHANGLPRGESAALISTFVSRTIPSAFIGQEAFKLRITQTALSCFRLHHRNRAAQPRFRVASDAIPDDRGGQTPRARARLLPAFHLSAPSPVHFGRTRSILEVRSFCHRLKLIAF